MVINTLHHVSHSNQARSRLILDKCHKNFRIARVIRTRFNKATSLTGLRFAPSYETALGARCGHPAEARKFVLDEVCIVSDSGWVASRRDGFPVKRMMRTSPN